MFSLYCRSAIRITDGFQAAFDYLKTLRPREDAAEVLWKTSHKMVVRFQVPQEYAPDRRQDYQVAWKLYMEKRFFRYLFRPSLAFREWEGFQRVAACGIPTGKVLAAAEERCGVRLKRSIFVTEYIPCTGDGDDFKAAGCRSHEAELIREFAEKNLRLLARLHRNGLVHGGFTPRNELYILKPESESRPGNRMEVIWIDLATCRKGSLLTRKKLQKKEMEFFLTSLNLAPEEREPLRRIYTEALKLEA